VVTPAVIRFVAGFAGCIAPNVNCVIFESEPVGVVEVSAVAFAAMSVSTMISGIESAPSHGSTPNQYQLSQMMTAETIGIPMMLHLIGSSMSFRQSSLFALRLKRPVNALMRSFGFAKRPTIDAVTIIATPHQRHHELVRWARPKTASAML
jgi:hypothetical protein